MTEATIRPMAEADLPTAERLSSDGFLELDSRMFRRSWPDPQPRSPERGEAWVIRTRHFLETDPGGCWVAEDADGMVGFATSYTRELMWILAGYAVRPRAQGQGIGKALLAAALHHGRGCLRGMLSASSDPKATRRYRQAGFSLHPQMFLAGHGGPLGAPRHRAGPGGIVGRHRADGQHRSTHPRRRARQ